MHYCYACCCLSSLMHSISVFLVQSWIKAQGNLSSAPESSSQDRYMGISRPDFITVNVPEIGAATGEDKIEYASMFNVTDLSSSTEVLLWRQYSNSSSNNSTHYTVDYLQRNGSGSLKETGDATPAEPLWTIPCTTSGVKGSSSSLQKGSGMKTPSL